MEGVNRGVIRGLGVQAEWDFSFVGSAGASGGILLTWNENVWRKHDEWRGRFSLSVALKKEDDHSMWLFSGVYGPVLRAEKGLFWEELVKVRESCSLPWCIGGDFNEVKEAGERLGCVRSNSNIQAFADFIAKYEFIDLPIAGASFTWSRGPSRSRLDRFLVTADWLVLVPESFTRALVHSVSDHCPIFLDPCLQLWGPPPFRFDLAWLNYPNMVDRLGNWWSSCYVEGPVDVVIGKKLYFVKNKLKEWSKEQYQVDQGR
ncbi:uncharacterized protein LOC143880730 [Tasmannia lanceolata]|uniref:uncharacterized protein LOC143880730 n=1 Tax=Tasmannia lanceolata TaxID=3420 RepID=UPI0040635C8C